MQTKSKSSALTFETVQLVRPRQPFAWRLSLMFLRGFGPMVGEQTLVGDALIKRIVHRGENIEFTVSAGDALTLKVKIAAPRELDETTIREVVARVAFFLSAHEDLSEFYELVGRDAPLAPVLEKLRGLHHVKFPSAFEAACWGAINQRIQLSVARRMKDSLSRALADGWAFPEAEAVMQAGFDDLCDTLGNEKKARTIFAIAEAFVGVDEGWLREGPIDEVEAWLTGIHGVGEFTSGFVLYRGLGRFVRQPTNMRFLEAAETIYGQPLDDKSARDLGARYGKWGGYWALYVWASTFSETRAKFVIPARSRRSNTIAV